MYCTSWRNYGSALPSELYSTGWSLEIVFGGKKCKSIALRLSVIRWAWQSSIKRAICLPAEANLQSSSLIHSSNNTPSMQLYLWLLNRRGNYFTYLKQWRFITFPTTNISSILPSAVIEAIPLVRALLFSPLEHISFFQWVVARFSRTFKPIYL